VSWRLEHRAQPTTEARTAASAGPQR